MSPPALTSRSPVSLHSIRRGRTCHEGASMRHYLALPLAASFVLVGSSFASAQNSVYIEELTWMEVRDAIKAGKTTVILPTGGTEQSGPHMVLGKENFAVHYSAGEIAKRL